MDLAETIERAMRIQKLYDYLKVSCEYVTKSSYRKFLIVGIRYHVTVKEFVRRLADYANSVLGLMLTISTPNNNPLRMGDSLSIKVDGFMEDPT